jgi:hypothetical protein
MTDGGFVSLVRYSPANRRLPVILLCLLVLISGLTGCSATRTAYNQLDWALTFYLARHFDLDGEQKTELRAAVDRNLSWHRQTQLPQYSAYLRELAATIDGSVTETDMRLAYDQILDFWDASMLHIVPDAQRFLSTLNDGQVQQIIVRMEENNERLFKEYSGFTEEERKANREKNTIKSIERFLGKLTSQQEQYVVDSLADMKDATADWVANRRRWQAAFLELVLERPPEAEYRQRLTELYVYPRRFDEPEFQETVDDNLNAALRLTTYLLNDLSPKQRERAQKQLTNYASDFEILGAQSVSE